MLHVKTIVLSLFLCLVLIACGDAPDDTADSLVVPSPHSQSLTSTAGEGSSNHLEEVPEGLDAAQAYARKPSEFVGTWDGMVEQEGVPPYEMTMTVEDSGQGFWTAKTVYPKFNCMSEFRSISVGTGTLRLGEIAAEGPCLKGGQVTLILPSRRDQSYASWEWRSADNQYVAISKLYQRIEGEVRTVTHEPSVKPQTHKTTASGESSKGNHSAFTQHMNGLDFIRFDSGSMPSMKYPTGADLSRAATWLAQNPGVKLRIEGRVDKTETRDSADAKELAGLRLDLVENFLWARGIPEANITRVNLGLEKPYGVDRSTESRVKNRSVRIVIVD